MSTDMGIWEMRRQIREAKTVLDDADTVAKDIALILRGRLRHIPRYLAAELKKRTKGL